MIILKQMSTYVHTFYQIANLQHNRVVIDTAIY